MVYVKPFKKIDRDIFDRLMIKGRYDVFDTNLTRNFGHKYKEIIDADFLEIARVEKKRKSIIQLTEDARIMPKNGKYFFYKIF